MPIYSQKTAFQLKKDLLRLEAELEAREPDLTSEIRLVRRMIASKEAEEERLGGAYSAVKTPWEAIELCLGLLGDFNLTKKEMVDAIVSGGYLGPRPVAVRGLINDSITYHLGKGNLVSKGEKVGLSKY